MIVVDANVAIAVLDPNDPFHHVAVERCVHAYDALILNLTRAEALIHPTRSGAAEQAAQALDSLGLTTHPVDDDIADQARLLRAEYGNRNFPLVDAIVVACGIVQRRTVVTADSKWPEMAGVEIEILSPTSA